MGKKIEIELTEEEYSLVSEHLSRVKVQIPVEQFVKDAALSMIPKGLERKIEAQKKAKELLNEVFRKADEEDGIFPQAPETTKVTRLPVLDTGHPCRWLNPERNPHYIGQSEGTCTHPHQTGRVCFWGAMSARQCPSFKPRIAPKVSAR